MYTKADMANAWQEGFETSDTCCGMCPSGACPWDNGGKGPQNPYKDQEGGGE